MSDNEPIILNHFPQIIQGLEEAAKVAVRHIAESIERGASASCPYDTGFLSASHYWVASDFSNYSQATAAALDIVGTRECLDEVEPPSDPKEAIVAVAASYAMPVHDGTEHMGGRPWLAQEAAGASARVLSETKSVFEVAIEAAGII